jgi:hypothetical protein
MSEPVHLLICSDIHYASDAEKERGHYEIAAVPSAWKRMLLRIYRHYIWLSDPFAHNQLLDRVLKPEREPDLVVANGDYSCYSAFIGVADPAARQSADICLSRLRERFRDRFSAVFGDHEIGKVTLCGGQGGLRLESLRVSEEELKLQTCWTRRIGRYVLIAVTSSLAAMPVYRAETLESERSEWSERARAHLAEISSAFAQLEPRDRVILFCHDPTALPFLWELSEIRKHISQIDRTVIGHLHSPALLLPSRLLRGMPTITFCGAAVRRMSAALGRAKLWQPFNVLLCPSLAGIELFKRGGYFTAELDPGGRRPASFTKHTIRR